MSKKPTAKTMRYQMKHAGRALWRRWITDLRTLQRQCARDGYEMLVSVKLQPAKKPRRSTAK